MWINIFITIVVQTTRQNIFINKKKMPFDSLEDIDSFEINVLLFEKFVIEMKKLPR